MSHFDLAESLKDATLAQFDKVLADWITNPVGEMEKLSIAKERRLLNIPKASGATLLTITIYCET